MKNSSNQNRNFKIAMTGVLGALSIVLSTTPLGYINIGVISLTIMHIPVILAAVLAGLVPGIATGLIFGLTSLIRSAMTGAATPMSACFLNPCVSVIPRMIFPVIVWLVFNGLDKLKLPKILSGAISAAIGTFCHTLLVMGAIYAFYGQLIMNVMKGAFEKFGFAVDSLNAFTGYVAIIACMEASNGIWEIIGAVVLTSAVMGSLFAVKGKKSKISSIEE